MVDLNECGVLRRMSGSCGEAEDGAVVVGGRRKQLDECQMVEGTSRRSSPRGEGSLASAVDSTVSRVEHDMHTLSR